MGVLGDDPALRGGAVLEGVGDGSDNLEGICRALVGKAVPTQARTHDAYG